MKIAFVYGAGIQLPVPLISVSYLAASVKASGRHEACLIDCYLQREKVRYVLDGIAKEKPDVVGFSVMSTYAEVSLGLAKEIKARHPGIKVIFGGVHAILRPDELMACPAVDAVCTGEGERVLVEYLDRLEGQAAASDIAGIWRRTSGGGVARNRERPVIEDLDSLPFPDWDIWDMGVYGNSLMYVLSSRGCPFDCAYCCAPALRESLGRGGRYYRVRSAGNVVAEITRNLARNGYRGFQPLMFVDSVFGLDKGWLREFAELYAREGLSGATPWKCLAVASCVDDEWARVAKDAGCFAVDMGLEHLDEGFRTGTLGKRIPDADFERALAALRRYGIPCELYLMIGSPGETFRDVVRSLFRARRFRPRFFCVNVFTPLPGTRMWERCGQRKKAKTGAYIEERTGPFQDWIPLVGGIKLLNQAYITALAVKLHGLRAARVLLAFIRLFFVRHPAPVDLIRLFNHHIQQYYIYAGLASRIRDGSYPAHGEGFYRRSCP